MATFNEILQSDATSKEKLTQLAHLVSLMRIAYGNTNVEVPSDYVNTPDGLVDFKYLDADSKVAFAGQQVRECTINAIEYCEGLPGAMLDRELEGQVATNQILCNLMTVSGSKYL